MRTRAEASAELVAKARHDPQAFAALYTTYVHRIYAFCAAHTDQREQAEDFTALTFERALRHIGTYEDRGLPFSAWLLRIAAHIIAEWARRNKHGILMQTSLPDDDALLGVDVSPDQWVQYWEEADWLQARIDSLSPAQRTVLRLRYWDELPLRDVAARMGRNGAATRQLLRRALIALRVQLMAEGDGIDDGHAQRPEHAERRGHWTPPSSIGSSRPADAPQSARGGRPPG